MTLLAIIFFIGVGATAIMDLWGWLRKRVFGGKGLDYGLVGRWIAHMRHGRFRHDNIADAPKMPGERLIGWSAHYGIGIAFAGLLIGLGGAEWAARPTLGPALAVGIGTAVGRGAGGQRAGRRHRRLENPQAQRRAAAKPAHPRGVRPGALHHSLGDARLGRPPILASPAKPCCYRLRGEAAQHLHKIALFPSHANLR